MRADGNGARFLPGTRGGSNPVFSPDGSWIAFSRERLGKGVSLGTAPWVARTDGSRARPLAKWRKGVEYKPSSFAPDGSGLAVTRTRIGSKPKALLLDLSGERHGRPLADFPASDPVFSPDGSWIALVRHSFSRRRRLESTHKDIYVMAADGSAGRRLTRTRWIAETNPSWDPSGQRIAFDSFRIGRDLFDAIFDELLPFGNSIVQVNADGTCRERLALLPETAIYGVSWRPGPERGAGRIECGERPDPSTAPAGPRLAVVKWGFSPFRFELGTIDAAGALPLRLAGGGLRQRPLPQIFEPPAWSPDGSKLAFVGTSGRLDGGPSGDRLYLVGAAGGRPLPLPGTRGASSPVFSSDGSAVAFARVRFRPAPNRGTEGRIAPQGASIWLTDPAGGEPRRITRVRHDLYMFPGSFSPDGSTMLATRYRGRRREAVAVQLGTGRITVLRRGEDPVYSPDGRRIALLRWRPLRLRDGSVVVTSDVYTMRADGTGLRRVTRTRRRDELFVSWSPSGERLAFVRHLPAIDEIDEREELGVGGMVVQMNSDGSCPRRVLREADTAIYGAAWQPGTGREAGRIEC